MLVLGMAFVSATCAAQSTRHAFAGTSSSAARDRARLLQLQQLPPGYVIVTWCDSRSVEDCEEGRHFYSSFGARAAERFAREHPIPFDMVLTDYVRFPAGYMQKAYGNVAFADCLLALRKHNIITPHTQIFLPNHPDLTSTISALTSRSHGTVVPATHNPLYLASAAVHPSLGYDHSCVKMTKDSMFISCNMS